MLTDPLAALRQATDARAAAGESTGNSAMAITMSEKDTHSEVPLAAEAGTAHVEKGSVQGSSRLSIAPVKPVATTIKPTRNTVYLYPEDLTQLRQIAGWLATEHGVRANDSMIVRACLALGERDVRLLHAIKETVLSDRRRTKQL